MASPREQQLEELECMLSMFPRAEELEVDAALLSELSSTGSGVQSDAPPVRYALRFQDTPVDGQVPELEIVFPAEYPLAEAAVDVRCSTLSRPDKQQLQSELQAMATAAARSGQVVALDLYQHMVSFLSGLLDRETTSMSIAGGEEAATDAVLTSQEETTLGRRAIYFHHIIATNKRRLVKELALDLGLAGFSKIGWPGVVVVEGPESAVEEYVRQLQRLRWKQMTVRGEQTQLGASVDDMRRLPLGFTEFPEDGMASLAAACRAAGVEELFLTVMKIYRRDEDAHDTSSNNKKSR